MGTYNPNEMSECHDTVMHHNGKRESSRRRSLSGVDGASVGDCSYHSFTFTIMIMIMIMPSFVAFFFFFFRLITRNSSPQRRPKLTRKLGDATLNQTQTKVSCLQLEVLGEGLVVAVGEAVQLAGAVAALLALGASVDVVDIELLGGLSAGGEVGPGVVLGTDLGAAERRQVLALGNRGSLGARGVGVELSVRHLDDLEDNVGPVEVLAGAARDGVSAGAHVLGVGVNAEGLEVILERAVLDADVVAEGLVVHNGHLLAGLVVVDDDVTADDVLEAGAQVGVVEVLLAVLVLSLDLALADDSVGAADVALGVGDTTLVDDEVGNFFGGPVVGEGGGVLQGGGSLLGDVLDLGGLLGGLLQEGLLELESRGGVGVVVAVVGLLAGVNADNVELGLVDGAGGEAEVGGVLRTDLVAEGLEKHVGEERGRGVDGLVDVELGLVEGDDDQAVGPLVQVDALGLAAGTVLGDGVLAEGEGVLVDLELGHVAVERAVLHALVRVGALVELDSHLLALVLVVVVVPVDDGALLGVVAGAVVRGVVVVVTAHADDLDLALGGSGVAAGAVVGVVTALVDGEALVRTVVVVLLESGDARGGRAAAGQQRAGADAGHGGADSDSEEHLHGERRRGGKG